MQTLFIDFDGTICFDRFWFSLSPNSYNKIQSRFFIQENYPYIADWMRGKYSAEEVCERVVSICDKDYETVWSSLKEGCASMYIDPKILELSNELRKRFYVVLITGNMDTFSRFTVPALKLERYFDKIVNSYDEKLLKTDNAGELFVKHSYSGEVSQDILIEDSLNSGKTFESLGGTYYQVGSKEDTITILEMLTA